MQNDTEPKASHQVEPTSATEIGDHAQAVHIETASLAITTSDENSTPVPQRAGPSEAPQEATAVSNGPSVVASQMVVQPRRNWQKRGSELPRGERWKRRLPQVCR